MHGGLVVPSTARISEVGQTPYEEGVGRRLESRQTGIDSGLEYRRLSELLLSIEPAINKALPSPRGLLRSSLEVMVFSKVPSRLWSRVRRSPFFRRRVAFLGVFRADDPVCRQYLWDSLPLYAAVSGKYQFEHLQDAPDFGWPPSEDESFAVDPEYARDPKRAVLFCDYGDKIFFEKNAPSTKFPADLPPVKRLPDAAVDPSTRALRALSRSPTTRISKLDDPAKRGRIRVPDVGFRYPDPMRNVDKIEKYCLAVGHSEEKWRGFLTAGYEASRVDDAYTLAAALCSSLLLDPKIIDARTTSDHHIQFGVDVALPTRRGGLIPVSTAWIFNQDDAPRLATAFVAGGASPELASTLRLPEAALADFEFLHEWVASASLLFAQPHFSDGGAAWGWLWIRHDHPRSAAFARWLRRGPLKDRTGIFTRRAYGGRVTQWSLRGEDGASTEARLRFVQHALLIAGVRTHVEFRWD